MTLPYSAPRPAPSAAAGRLLDKVTTWLFDMDNSLYPARANLFGQIDVRMQDYVAKLLGVDGPAARAVQKRYFHEHGTTLRGLMLSHGVDPHDFLGYVHDLDFSVLDPDAALRRALLALPGRKIVFTNGDRPYAEKVLETLGILDTFEDIFDIHAMDYQPKPHASTYRGVLGRYGLEPATTFFADDMAHNLAPAHALGMTTLWVNNGSERGAHGYAPDFVDYETGDLTDWLVGLLEG